VHDGIVVGNNPVNFIDPTGLAWSDIPGGVKTAVSGGANAIIDIAKNGPPEAKALMAFAAATEVIPLAIAASQSAPATAAAYRLAPYSETFVDYISSSLPATPPAPNWAGAAGAVTNYLYEKFTDSSSSCGK